MQSYSKNKHRRWVWASPASCVHAPLKAGVPSVGAGASLLLMAPMNPATGPGALQTHADQDPYSHPKKHLQRGNVFPRRDQTGTTSQLRSSQPHTWFLCSACIDAVPRGTVSHRLGSIPQLERLTHCHQGVPCIPVHPGETADLCFHNEAGQETLHFQYFRGFTIIKKSKGKAPPAHCKSIAGSTLMNPGARSYRTALYI